MPSLTAHLHWAREIYEPCNIGRRGFLPPLLLPARTRPLYGVRDDGAASPTQFPPAPAASRSATFCAIASFASPS